MSVHPVRIVSDTLRTTKGRVINIDSDRFEYVSYFPKKNGDQMFRCVLRSCPGRGVIKAGMSALTRTASHTHSLPDFSVEKRQARKLAVCMRKNGTSAKDVKHQVKQVLPPAVHPFLPSDAAFVRVAQRAVEIQGSTAWPQDITGQFLENGVDQVRFDNCSSFPARPSAGAMKLIASDRGISMLNRHGDWSVDGTFYCSPRLFSQVVIVGVQVGHLFRAAAYVFMTSKCAADYALLFRKLVEAGVTSSPSTLRTDFELGFGAAARSVFGNNVCILFCAFHFGQNLIRRIQECRLFTRYQNDAAFKLDMKCFQSLCLIAYQQIPAYHSALKAHIHSIYRADMDFVQISDFIRYFEDAYIGGARSAQYKMCQWSVHSSILSNSPTSSSAHESFNSRLKAIPKNRSSALVCSKLLELDRRLAGEEEEARLANITIDQHKPRQSAKAASMKRLKEAIENGKPRNVSRVEYLKMLSTHLGN